MHATYRRPTPNSNGNNAAFAPKLEETEMTTKSTGARSVRRGILKALCVGAVVASLLPIGTVHAADTEDDIWPSIRSELFDDRAIASETGKVTLDAPYRAQDAAVVPLAITIPADIARETKTLTLIVDKNPAPVVATFKFGDAAGVGARKIETRVRVDMYSNVRAIIETNSGELHMTTKFVKAAGGCSAPALKDMDSALANIGKMKLRWITAPQQSSPMKEAQVMVRHPNYSGMQMNQLTGLYIPAKFVEAMTVKKGDAVVFEMEGGISLSENPNIRFTYASGTPGPLSVVVRDTDGKTFNAEIRPTGS